MSVNVINKSKAKLFSHILTAGTTGGVGGGGGMNSTVYPPKKSRASHDVVSRSSKSTTVQSPPDKKQAKSTSQINWSDDSSSDSEDESLKHKATKKLKRGKKTLFLLLKGSRLLGLAIGFWPSRQAFLTDIEKP